MSGLVDDLFDLSGIDAGVLAVKRVPIDLRSALWQAAEMSAPHLREARHVFELDVPEVQLPVIGDHDRLVRVFSNLLNNAAIYTPAGGRVLLKATATEDKIEVTVRDSGIGIPAGFSESIFGMFSQITEAVPNRRGGLGIGLSLVRQLVEAHEGKVTAVSEGQGKGTDFVVSLPLAK